MKLLKNLYCIHSMSGQEGAMRKFVKSYVKGLGEDIKFRQDHGNIYITKGSAESYPCVVAHLDQVQTKHSADFDVYKMKDGRLIGYSLENGRQEGLGADDKNGIWVALKCLEEFDCIKVAFFWGEETGCEGSSICDIEFFKDCRFVIQADRRNGGDLITDISGMGICSDEFKSALFPIASRYGYKETSGLMTDVEQLVYRGCGVSCINISCGYYNPHTDVEFTMLLELENCLNFVREIIRTLTETFPYKCKAPRRGTYWWGWNEPELVNFLDYPGVEEAIWDLACYNCEDYWGKDLWPWVSADCETFGVTEDEFCQLYDSYVEDIVFDAYENMSPQPA